MSDARQRPLDEHSLKLYMLVNNTKNAKKNSYLGCSRDPYTRLAQHNSTDPRVINVAVDRRARGGAPWTLVMVLVLPEDRQVSGRALQQYWDKTRTPPGRFRQGITIATALQLSCYVNTHALLHDANFADTGFMELRDLTLSRCTQDDADCQLRHVSIPQKIGSTVVGGIDFSKSAEPLRLFHKKRRGKMPTSTVVQVTDLDDLFTEVLS